MINLVKVEAFMIDVVRELSGDGRFSWQDLRQQSLGWQATKK